ncbi:MAG: thiamine phosphate synthase [Clostridia bacterium]|nr:thiamine phosphate synthase [Clostridia bacterium]
MTSFTKDSALLYAVTGNDTAFLSDRVIQAIHGGASTIQLRLKKSDKKQIATIAKELLPICRKHNVPLIINDHADILTETDADGVHIGQGDGDIKEIRRIIGPSKILGVSTHSVAEAVEAQKCGADYIGAGALFQTSTKKDTTPLSLATLHTICAAVDIPVIAIGGINANNISLLRGTGISGVAVSGAIFNDAIENSVSNLHRLSQSITNSRFIEGAIFDMDGTLIDSMPKWSVVAQDFLISMGKTPRDDLGEIIKPMSVRNAAKYFISDYGVNLSVDEITDGINHQMQGYYLNEFELKKGTKEFLEFFSSLGIKMCIATATDKRLATAALKRNGILDFFGEIFTCGELNCSKREPTIFEAALDFLGTKKERTYVFEDSFFAIDVAKKAGFKVAAVYDEAAEEYSAQIENTADIYSTLKEMRHAF